MGVQSLRPILSVGIAVILSLLPFAAYAAETAGINVPAAGDYYYWLDYTDVNGKQVTTIPSGFKDKKTTADLPLVKDAVPKCTLFVLDAKTGNEAVLAIEEKPEGPVTFDLKLSDFNLVRRVEIVVTSASMGQPAAAAVVELEDGEGKVQTRILDPSARGSVEFTDVASGTARVTVTYGEGRTTSQDIDIALDRADVVPAVEVPVVGEVETIQPAAGVERTDGEAGKAGSPGTARAQPINFAMALVGLVLLVAIVYAAYVTMRNRGATFRGILKKVGIEVSDEEQAAAPSQVAPSAPVDPSVCPFCGGKKDPATGKCGCSVEAAGVSAPVADSGPRLVVTQGAYAGNIYTLEADAVTIGREESNTIAFPDDNTVSRTHARISKADGDLTICDEGSSNGTFVNGVKITEQVLHAGDEIQVGSARLRFEV